MSPPFILSWKNGWGWQIHLQSERRAWIFPCCPGQKAKFISLKQLKERIENKRDSKDEMATAMTPSTPPKRRQKWTKQQYREIILATNYQYAKKTEGGGTTLDTYRIWRDRNPDIFPGMNPKNLCNQRPSWEKTNSQNQKSTKSFQMLPPRC